jgi:L-asparaginase / beta-aspartyl-peptidase
MEAIVVGSANASVGIVQAIERLRAGGSAVDAVVEAIRHVEANPADHSVGYSGLPNLLGEVELDASIMEGRGLRYGAVGALKGYQDAIDLARRVMDELPHSLIVGDGAARFAADNGLTPVELLTPEAARIWRERMDQSDGWSGANAAYADRMRALVRVITSDPELAARGSIDEEPPHGTTNVIARDRDGRIACGVSTSGWAWKYPGRLGDSPIAGAGNYADDRWGAAACTGRGEMAQRCLTAHSVVTFLRFGMTLEEALRTAMDDLRALDDPVASEMNIVALDKDGNHAGASTTAEKTYIAMTESMSTWETRPRLFVQLEPS